MRRRHFLLKMGFRGRPGLLACVLFGTAVLVVVYYAWNSFFASASGSRISYSSVQGVARGQVERWDAAMDRPPVIDDPPIGLNKEIELQVQGEKWKKAKALQDRIDEERLAEEQAAQGRGENIDNILKAPVNNQEAGEKNPQPLLFQPPDPVDGDYFSRLERIVHLDLKGAPPLVSYLEKLFPVLKTLGATGILIEYEDMFPYTGNVSMLASTSAYSLSDLKRIQDAAKSSSLEMIPLVQTFGHMEFALKYKEFQHLREHEYTPQVITPVREESYTLIFNMLRQVLKAHPDSRRVHLGCDEVYGLGQGQSNTYMTGQRLTPQKLFLQHVSKMTRRLKKEFPAFQSLIWDDWLRFIPLEDLLSSGLPGLVEPVVWYYRHDILRRVPEGVWGNYSKAFSAVWVASAFKGATGSDQILTNASMHIDNNLQWISLMRKLGAQSKKITFRGTVLTGWQRYDHFATLCELLPVGLPSLALNLQALRSGAFGPGEMDRAKEVLRCSSSLDLGFPALHKGGAKVTQDCRFPGSEIFYSVHQLWGIMENYRRDEGLQDQISGWMTDYQLYIGISNPGRMKLLSTKLAKVIQKLRELEGPIRTRMLEVFDKWTVDEWITTNLLDRANQIKKLYDQSNKLLERRVWPARPFPDPPQVGGAAVGQAPAVQGGAQFGPQNNRVHRLPAGAGPRQPVNPSGLGGQGTYGARLAQGGLGVGQQLDAVANNLMGVRRGVLPQTNLAKPGQNLQGRPSGPSNMFNDGPNTLRPRPQRQQSVNFHAAPDQKPQGSQGLGQYGQGRPRQLPSRQNLQSANMNQFGVRANQYNRFQGLAPNIPPQLGQQQPQNRVGFGQNPQGSLVQEQLMRKSDQDPPQASSERRAPLRGQGPPQADNKLLKLQPLPPAKEGEGQGGAGSQADVNRQSSQDQKLQGPVRANGYLGANRDVPASKQAGLVNRRGQDGKLLNSFLGQGFKDRDDQNHISDDHPARDDNKNEKPQKAAVDYDADDDEPLK